MSILSALHVGALVSISGNYFSSHSYHMCMEKFISFRTFGANEYYLLLLK